MKIHDPLGLRGFNCMKIHFFRWSWSVPSHALIGVISLGNALVQPAVGVGGTLNDEYVCVQRGPHSRVWQRSIVTTNYAGIVRTNIHSYTELATGLCYIQNGQYVDSVEQIVPVADGAQAVQGRHQVHWATDINTPGGAVTLTSPDGKQLVSGIFGLLYYDSSTGSNVLLSQIQDSTATIDGASPNVLIYTNAFSNLTADVRYTYRKAGLSQDIILHQQPPAPAEYGMNPQTTWLQVITEFFNSPAPQICATTQNGMSNCSQITFGQMRMGIGHAFLFQNDGGSSMGPAVAKQWTNIDNRTFLIEQVPYNSVSSLLQTLHSSTIKPDRNRVRRTVELKPSTPHKVSATRQTVRVSKLMSPGSGLVLDYDLSGNTSDFTFQGDTTYVITGSFAVSNTITIEGGTVVKFATAGRQTVSAANYVCETAPYRPGVFTSVDDNSVGDTTGSGTPTVSRTTYLTYDPISTNGAIFEHLRFAYAGGAVGTFLSAAGSSPITIQDCQFVNCGAACSISPFDLSGSAPDCTINFYNDLFAQCGEAASEYFPYGSTNVFTNKFLNVTADRLSYLVYCSGTNEPSYATNCIFTAVTNLNLSSSSCCITNASGSGIYQTVGAAGYYLADDSTNQGAGTTNIVMNLLADLGTKTTYPPIVMTNGWLTNDYTFFPQVPRDNSGSSVDLGYHYDSIDYAISIEISNCTATVLPGTTLAATGTWWGYGIWPFNNATFTSEGTATSPVYLVRYNTVQEQSNPNWEFSGGPTTDLIYANPFFYTPESLSFHFTQFCLLGGSDAHFEADFSNSTPFTLQDCQFFGGTIDWSAPPILCSNCLFDRVNLFLGDDFGPAADAFCNNLFFGGELTYYHQDVGAWTFRDNLFDQAEISQWGNAIDVCSTNAYVTTDFGTLVPSGGAVILTNSPAYETGFLGDYYYPTNQTNLIFTGSQPASAAGLYHYTVTTNNVIDGTNLVSIGFHYVACSNGVPISTPGDGLPDYLADINGNGIVDPGERSWTNYVSFNGLTSAAGLVVFTPLQ